MFGLFYMAANAIAYMVSGTKCAIEDHQSKERAIQKRSEGKNIENLYMDHRGTMRDITTNQIRHVYADKNGDAWLEDVHGNKLRNLSQEKRNVEFRENVKNNPGRKAVSYTFWNQRNSPVMIDERNRLTGEVFKDVDNGDLYLKRNFVMWDKETLYPKLIGYSRPTYRANFYLRINDGMIVGLNDDDKQPENIYKGKELFLTPNEEEVNEFIESFNKKQKEGGWQNSYYRDNNIDLYNMNGKDQFYLMG